LYRQGRYVEASKSIVSAESSASEYWKAEKLKGDGDEDLKTMLSRRSLIAARARNLDGMNYQAQGNYSRAKFSYSLALGSFKELVGERNSEYANCLNHVAGMHLVQREYDKAEPLFKQAQEIRKEALGTQHADYADSLLSLSRFWGTLGDYARAEALCQQALKINKEALGEENPHYVACLHQLARLYQVREDYVKAEPLFRRVLAISKKALGEQHPDYAACLNDLAGAHQAQGDHDRAAALFKQALEITREWQLHEVDVLNKKLEALEELGDEWWANFQRDYHKGVLREKHPHYVACLNNLARFYQAQGEYDKAELYFKKVVEIVQPPKSERASEISLRLHRQGISDYVQSLKSLAGLYLARGKNEPGKPQPLIPVQSVELAQGDHEKARVLYLRVIGAQAQSQEWKKRLTVNLEGVKGAERAAGFDRQTGFPTTVRVFNASDFRPLPGNVMLLADYGQLLEKRLPARPREDQLRGCDHAYALSLALLDRMRDEVLEHEASKLQHGAGLFEVIPRRLGICQRLFALEGKSGGNVEYLHKAFSTAELGRARVFLETLGRSRASLLGGVSPEMHAREVALLDKLRSYDAMIAEEWSKLSEKETKSTQEPLAVRKLRDEQGKSEKQLQELIGEMEKTYPQYAALKHPKPCTVEQARDCLGANEVALLFVLGKETSYLLLVESHAAVKDPAKALAIYSLPRGEEIGDLVNGLTDLETLALPARARTLGRGGYEQLLRPVAERIKGKDLVIVPGESLCYLPFELLVEDGKYLIENHRIRYAPSMTALHMMRQWQDKRTKQPDQGLWAMGDPVYDVRDSRLAGPGAMASASQDAVKNYQISEGREGETAFPRLIHTAREVDDIGKLLNASAENVRTGERALESAVKAASVSGQLARHRYVHFATHGILGVAEGQPPALVLSLVGENGERDAMGVNDGFLRLGEVTNLKLNADLVVLSACRTGQGKLLRGEGVSGLARAFLYAGSRGVVCSLWSVDDQQTANLMTDMYRRLKEGSTAAHALHEAKLELIRADRAPIYWAPFILIGE
jgi:CHAT domain-containing protein/lipopolysaccharide biosynthesis regulator YciM